MPQVHSRCATEAHGMRDPTRVDISPCASWGSAARAHAVYKRAPVWPASANRRASWPTLTDLGSSLHRGGCAQYQLAPCTCSRRYQCKI